MRFIPIPLLIAGILILGKSGKAGGPGQIAYLIVGGVLIVVTAIFGFLEIQRVWRADLAIRWTLLAGELFICAVNAVLLALGYGFFKNPRARGYPSFISQCGVACVLIALTAAINSRHWTEITHSYLDVVHPVPYKVRNPDAAGALKNWIEKNKTEAGQDLVALSGNSEFLYALENSPFYKQDFDEALQFSRPSVIFGFRDVPSSALRRPQFLLIRFPAELSAILQFEPVTPAVAR